MTKAELRLLGGCELRVADGSLLRLSSRKSFALLAILAERADRAVPREEIATLLWGDRTEDQARASLRQELSVLRRTLSRVGLEVIEASKEAVLLDTRELFLDVQRVETLCATATPEAAAEVAELYRGEFLAGLDIRSEAFEEWRRLCREQIRDRVLERLHAALLYAPAEPGIARTLLRIDETNEEAHRTLMRHLWQSGRRGEALQQYQRCVEALRRELDAEPDQDTFELYEEIRDTAGPGPARPPVHPAPRAEATVPERREMTVAAIGLASADELERDPEDIVALLTRLAEVCRARVEPAGGKVLVQADGRVLALFGHPRADEADPERAVYAALDLVKRGFTDAAGQAVDLRAGLAMGETVVTRNDDRMLMSVAGPAVITASRLELQAGPGEVRISGAMRRSLRDRFRTIPVPGGEGSHPAQIVLGESLYADRFLASGAASRLTALTGRAEELGALAALWAEVTGGKTRVAVLRGEAGIGKSRLLAAFKQHAMADDPQILQFQSSPHHRQSALYPLVHYLQEMLGFARLPSPEERQRALRHWLATRSGLDTAQVEQVLVALLGLSSAPDATPIDQDVLIAAVAALLRAAVREGRPVLMIVEDLHWLDPTSQLLLARLATELANLPLMMLGSSRQPPGIAVPAPSAMRNITLRRLDRAQARALVTDICPPDWPAARIDAIVERSDGIPLYLEELVRTAAEGGDGAIPDSLHASLTARIDRLDGARSVLQQAAVIGRVFDTATLSRLTGRAPEALEAALQELQGHDLVYRLGPAPDARYEFKHALVQEQAYQTLLLAERAELHGRLGTILAEASVPAPAELVATHFELGGRPLDAIARLETAGKQALRVAAHSEAAAHFGRALTLARTQPDRAGAAALELKFLLLRGPQLIALHGFAAEEVAQTYAQALTLADSSGDPMERAHVHWGLWSFYVVRADIATALRIARKLLALCEEAQDEVGIVAGHYALGVTQYYAGDLGPAQRAFEAALEQHLPDLALEEIERYGLDLSVCARSYLGWLHALRGEVEAAELSSAWAIATSSALKHVFSMTFAHVFTGVMQHFLRRPEAAQRHGEIAARIAAEHGYAQWLAQSDMVTGHARALKGDPEGALQLERGTAAYLDTGACLALPYARAWLAETRLRDGQREEARALLQEARRVTEESGVTYFDAELQRLLARCGGDAQALLTGALQSARRSGATLLALRAAMDLARTEGATGGPAALSAVLAELAPGQRSRDLDDAEALEAALRAPAPLRGDEA
ncbi:AAA family ATPase (plasmid) [Salipiger sp. H15]|uniref:AAA family ATPase n=1 Tax=Alloyangia sp. H15 TaxID=3029062 RepID=A0AAU8APL4_9RHOB